VAACVAAVLAIASPAVGGPSIANVSKVAKKALTTGKKADKNARSARSRANQAYGLASQANSMATTAVQRGQITQVQSAQVPFGPSDLVQSAVATCPAGQHVISGGGFSLTDEELAATEPVGSTGWGVIGVDLVDDGGEYIQAYALCAPAGVAVAAGRDTSRTEFAAKVVALRKQVK
jgi:hypothetical protein